MFKAVTLAGVLSLLLGSTAMAACPPGASGNTSEAIRANEQRVLCLQQEVDDSARQRHFDMRLRQNETAIQQLQMQRRFDNLPRVIAPAPSPFTQPRPFVPN